MLAKQLADRMERLRNIASGEGSGTGDISASRCIAEANLWSFIEGLIDRGILAPGEADEIKRARSAWDANRGYRP